MLGHRPVCAVEIEQYPRKVLLQRQRDGVLPRFPIWDDVRTFDGKPWRGKVDVVCGGFPCQDISSNGNGAGIRGSRSGLWKEYARIIGEIRPNYVFAENSPLLRKRGLDVVLRDLAVLGYDAKWCVLGAGDVKAPHLRKRMWVLAYPAGGRLEWRFDEEERQSAQLVGSPWMGESPKQAASRLLGVDDGMADRVGRIKAAGNGQVPQVVKLAWELLAENRGIDGNQHN